MDNIILQHEEHRVLIHYADEDIVIAEKPVGITVSPHPDVEDVSLKEIIVASLPGAENYSSVHQIDMGTSGIVAGGKTSYGRRQLAEQFSHRLTDKVYLALVDAQINAGIHIVVDAPIKKINYEPFRSYVKPNGKKALTKFYSLGPINNYQTLMVIKILQGRTHQIRVHAQHAKIPISEDPMYNESFPGEWQLLHATHLKIFHPNDYNFETKNPNPASVPLSFTSLPTWLNDDYSWLLNDLGNMTKDVFDQISY